MEQQIYNVILKLLNFEQASISRHAVVLDLLNVLETRGEHIPEDLITAVHNTSEGDKEAVEIISRVVTRCRRK